MSLTFCLSSILFLIIVIRFFVRYCKRNPKFVKAASTLPGPPEIPGIGNGLEFFFCGKRGIANVELQHYGKYGGIYRLWFGNQLWIALSEIEDIAAVFSNSKTIGRLSILPEFNDFYGEGVFATQSRFNAGKIDKFLTDNYLDRNRRVAEWKIVAIVNNTMTVDGRKGELNLFIVQHTSSFVKKWKEERIRIYQSLNRNTVKSFIPMANDLISEFVENLQKLANGREFDIKQLFVDLTFDMLSKVGFNCRLSSKEKLEMDTLDTGKKINWFLSARLFLPLLGTQVPKFLVNKFSLDRIRALLDNCLKKMMKNQSAILQDQTAEEDEYGQQSIMKSFVSLSYRMYQESGEEQLMLDEILALLLPAINTPARVLSYCLLMLAIHKEVQEKLYAEIYQVFGNDGKPIEMDDLHKLPYLDRVWRESQRLYMAVTVLFRELEEDTRIGMHEFPAGTGLLIYVANVHLNPKYYPEPNKFNPDNFTREAESQRPRYTFLAKGGGGRLCPGRDYADIMSKLILIAMVRKYKFSTSMKMEEVKLLRKTITFLESGNIITMEKR